MDGGSSSGNLWLLITLFVFLVIFGGYFAGAESSFSAMNRIKIQSLADDGNRRAKRALYISNNFDRALTALLIGNNITHIAASAVATVIAYEIWGEESAVYCTVVTTIIVFLFSEMIPKSFANDRSESMSLLCASSLRFLMKILTPLVAFFTAISRFVSKLFKSEEQPSITEDELYDIIDTIEEEGVMDEEQSDLLKSALEFDDTKVADVMTMRGDIEAISDEMSNDEILKVICTGNHSRLPVYHGDIDHIVGILQIRNFLKAYSKDPDTKITDHMFEPFFVREFEKIDDLLTMMRQRKIYIAIASDEDEKTLGLVTIEDFLEELVGEIWDEDDVVDNNFIKMGGNHFLVSTKLTVGDACSKIGCKCPQKNIVTRPIISWLLEIFGHMPEEDETFTVKDIEIRVDEVENGHATKVEIHVLSPEEIAERASADSSADAEAKA